MDSHRLLIVEDDPNLGKILKEFLEIKGYQADLAEDGEKGGKMFHDNPYDLCILDVMLPKKDGFELAREIRLSSNKTPFIFLTAKSLQEDTIQGFKIGADDYIVKPFSMEELLLRIQVILRRENVEELLANGKFEIGTMTFDPDTQQLTSGNNARTLTHKESELLRLLSIHKNRVLDRKLALNMIWRDDSYFHARSMDVYIAKLRKYLKEDPSVAIMTIHGKGFKLVDSAESS